jgi:hypothetical protein
MPLEKINLKVEEYVQDNLEGLGSHGIKIMAMVGFSPAPRYACRFRDGGCQY